MPKLSTSARQASYNDGKIKRAKHRSHQYRDAAKVRKLRQTRIKGVVEEVVEPVELGKARPLRRGPKYDLARIERKLRAKFEENQPTNNPTAPVEVYGANPINFNAPQVVAPTSEATKKRKQAAATDDDGDTTDVDDSDDVVVVPAGFVEAAENLGLLSTPAASGPCKDLEEPPSAYRAQPDEEPPATQHSSTKIETPTLSPAIPQTFSSASYSSPSSSVQASKVVPESAIVEVVHHDSQTTTTTTFPTHLESSEPNASTSMQQASISGSSQGPAWSFTSQHQNSTSCNTHDADAFHFHQQDIQNAFYLGSTSDDDVNMEFSGATITESPAYSLPTMWTSPQPQSEHQTFYSHIGQVADNSSHYQTYTTDNFHPGWAAMQQFQLLQSESVQQSAEINQPPYNHLVECLAAASRFWIVLGTFSLS